MVVQGQGQAGLGREAEVTASLQGFLVFLFEHADGLSLCKLLLDSYFARSWCVLSAETQKGGKGSWALESARMKLWIYESFT